MTLGRTGFIGRFKPLHNGGAVALDELCAASDHVTIGIGSANRPLSASNPFTADESEAMLHAYLAPRHRNYEIIRIDDFGHLPQYADGKRWKQELIDRFGETGPIDRFVTGNPYVRDLLADTYTLLHPIDVIPPERYIHLCATDVRRAIAAGTPWTHLVPPEVAQYLEREGRIERLRQRFGERILQHLANAENVGGEREKVREVYG